MKKRNRKMSTIFIENVSGTQVEVGCMRVSGKSFVAMKVFSGKNQSQETIMPRYLLHSKNLNSQLCRVFRDHPVLLPLFRIHVHFPHSFLC